MQSADHLAAMFKSNFEGRNFFILGHIKEKVIDHE